MQNDLLEIARQQAEKSEPSVRAAALLRIARADYPNADQARSTLVEALNAVRELPHPVRLSLLDEARSVAAAVSPELLAEIPQHDGLRRITSLSLVQVMLTHGHADAAFDYLMQYKDADSFPFFSVSGVLHRMDPSRPDAADRRSKLLHRAVMMWNRAPRDIRPHERGQFEKLFGHFWEEFHRDEAIAIAHMIVHRASEAPDHGTSSRYPDGIHFTSLRQNTLFEILHVLRHLDPALAQSLIDSNDQLAAAARRYPNGLETLHKEVEAETARRKAAGQTGGCFLFAGDPKDVERQRRLFEATRNGDFEPSIQDGLEKYNEDIAPETRNYAPKGYWPSTGAFRSLFYEAGKRLGPEAIKLLERVPDDDLRLFATIELAAGLAGVPASSISRMKQPRPVDPRLEP